MQFEDIYNALFNRAALKSNQSTQCQPLSATNYLYELDKITKDIITLITESQKTGAPIKVKDSSEEFQPSNGSTVPLGKLSHLRRQFITYIKSHPVDDVKTIPTLFIHYLNSHC